MAQSHFGNTGTVIVAASASVAMHKWEWFPKISYFGYGTTVIVPERRYLTAAIELWIYMGTVLKDISLLVYYY